MNLIKSCCLFVVFSSFLACTPQVSDVKSMSYTEFVNPFIGTDFTGNTYPGAQAPFGMVQLSPDNGLPGWDRISGYFYPDSTIAGFSHTHLSGTGAGDLYDISFMPVTLPYKEAEAPLGIHSLFSHSEESASAGYYQVRLKDYNINVELTATERCGIQRYTFPKADAAVFLNLRKAMNWDFTNDSHIEVVDSVTVQGYRYSDGWARDQRLYFRTRFSKPFVVMQLDTAAIEKDGKRIGTSVIARFDFQTKEGEQILVSTAISGVSMEGAARNLAAEVPDDDFDKYLAAVQDDWRQMFNDALFHLLQPVVIAIQDFLCMGKIEIILAVFVPWQIDNRLHILRLDREIRRLRMQALQLAHLLLKRFSYSQRPFFLGSFLSQFPYFQIIDISS